MAASGATNGIAGIVGANISAARKSKGLTQHQLAVLLGTGDQMTISRWERGEHRPSDENLIRVARALNVDVAQLFMEKAA